MQLEMLVPAGLPPKNTIRSKVLQAKFGEISGKSSMGVPKCHTGGEREHRHPGHGGTWNFLGWQP